MDSFNYLAPIVLHSKRAVAFKKICPFIILSFFRRYSIAPLPLNVGWT